MGARVPDPPRLPEEIDPKSPPLSRFRTLPPPPLLPRLFPDEARFALRLSILAGCTEFVAWAWLAAERRGGAVVLLAALRLLKPLWAAVGTRLPRPAVAFALLFAGTVGVVASIVTIREMLLVGLLGAGLPALSDLCATCIADSVTVERRSAAYAWLDMGQGLGGAAGLALGAAYGSIALLASPLALLAGAVGVPDLHDRGTPRSSWPPSSYAAVLASPLGAQLALAAFATGVLAGPSAAHFFGGAGPLPAIPRWAALLVPFAGMLAAARLEPRLPNALILPRACALLAAVGLGLWPPLQAFALGAMFAAIPASVARGAGEMERPLASSLAWSALITGAAAG